MSRYLSRLFYLLENKKIGLIILLFLSFLVSFLEAFGIGLIGPFLALASNPNLVKEKSWLTQIYIRSGFTSESYLVGTLGLLVILVFLFRTLVTWWVKTYNFNFIFDYKRQFSLRLIELYLSAPYTFHLSRNSTYIVHSVTQYTKVFCEDILYNITGAISNLIMILALSVLLCNTNINAVIVVLLIFLPLLIIENKLKGKIREWGKILNKSSEAMMRIINHSLGGIKETKIIGCELYFKKQLEKQIEKNENAATQFYSSRIIPRLISDTILIIFLIGFTSIYLIFQGTIQELLPVLGIFSMASLRLTPAITNLTNQVSKLRSSSYVLNKIYLDVKELKTQPNEQVIEIASHLKLGNPYSEARGPNNEIILDAITYSYPNTSEKALDNVSLIIKKGQSIALIGKSGAGKTTLVDVILGLLMPDSGDIKTDSKSIYEDLRCWQNRIGYIPQSIFLIDDTIERNIAFGVPDSLINQQRLETSIQAAQLVEVIKDLPDGIKTRVGERGVRLSGGQRQRIGIARALYHEREILVLDEATSALDNETETLVTEAIKSLTGTKTMIIIAHRLTTVQHCDRIYSMKKGRIVKSGSYEEVILGESLQLDR